MIDQIILSCNEDKTYMEFWEPVSRAYKKIFPEVTVHLAFLTNRSEDDSLVQQFRKSGKVTLFKPYPFLQEFTQAKLIRFILAAQQGTDVCYIDDIDLFPLKKSFITDKTDQRPKDHLLCVGGEVYDHNGCYPVSQMTAEGYIWKKFINPAGLDYKSLIDHYLILPEMFDRRENLLIPLDFTQDSYFSDERFLRKLLVYNPVDKFELERGYSDFMTATIDRYDWTKFSQEKLDNHGYENAHGRRPYNKFKDDYVPLIEYINKNY
jgi:hypothetical protein